MRRRACVAIATAALAAVLALCPAGAQAGRLQTGILDASVAPAVLDDVVAVRAGTIRFNLPWRGVAPGPPANPADPADPAYNFAAIDAAVRAADQRGLRVLMTVTGAPDFAEGRNRPRRVTPGTWKPRPAAYKQFARAVARRYSGSYAPPAQATLPRVRHFQAWNEANLDTHLSPQYVGKKRFATDHYKRMLNAFYDGIHEIQPGAVVVTAGTAPYGERPGGHRTRPLTFWRDVFCLKGRRALRPVKCKTKPKLDVLAHHPINTSGGPQRSALHPDDASTPDFKHLRAILRKAEKSNRVTPGGRRALWVTELWWESKPPDRCGVSLKKHAAYVTRSLRLLRKQGASLVIWLSMRDQPARRRECGRESLQSGLTFADGRRKPAFRAFKKFG